MIATRLRPGADAGLLWRSLAPALISGALLVAIGIELAVLVAWVPGTVHHFIHVEPGDWGNLYVRARHLRLMGLYSPILTPLLFPISLAGIINGYRILFALNVVAALTIAWIAQRPLHSPEARIAVALAVISLPQLHWAIRFGHVTPLLALAALGALLLVQRHPKRGAALLAAMSIKPQYAIAPFLYLAVRRQFRLLALMIAVSGVGAAVGFAVVGPSSVGAYIGDALNWGPNSTTNLMPVQQAWMYSWPGFLVSIGLEPNRLVSTDLLLLSAAVAAVACARLDARKAVVVVPLAMILVTPYSMFYDACLITVAFALVVRAELPPGFAGGMIAVLYVAALATQVNTHFPVQNLLGAASTDGPFWLTPALLGAIGALAFAGGSRAVSEEALDGR